MTTDAEAAWAAGLFEVQSRDGVERILHLFLPWLGSRRFEKALDALALISASRIFHACETCGNPFETYRNIQRFCSVPCQQKGYYTRHGHVPVAERATA